MRILLVDNYDSYTYNLYDLITEVTGTAPMVVRHDDPVLCGPVDVDGVVISPGPGRPGRARDVGHLPELLRRHESPILGVCLGHQLIGHAAGAAVTAAPQPRHGHLATVTHDGDRLFDGVPREFTAVRYHSLRVAEPLPDGLTATGWADDGVLMALRQPGRSRWGVQFHPESVASQHGRRIVGNFADLVRERAGTGSASAPPVKAEPQAAAPVSDLRVFVRELDRPVDAGAAFDRCFADSRYAFWLDSARVEPGLSRFSFLGDTSGPLREVLTYRVGSGGVRVTDASGEHIVDGDVFSVLDSRLAARRIAPTGLPFDLTGGYVGYFGYELKADSCGVANRYTADTPDAVWLFATRMIAIDHHTGRSYVLAIHDSGSDGEARRWVERTVTALRDADPPENLQADVDESVDLAEHLVVGRDAYLAAIEECRRELVRGESYEINLTTQARLRYAEDDHGFYRRLRAVNPAPYGAYLRLGPVSVCSASPERFLRISAGSVEAKPIKGTAPRDPDPAQDAALATALACDPKTRAENLMIVDLLRNDLTRVCEPGSITVDGFLTVESYATVHQLVSTIRGRLRPEVSPVHCVLSCFPGGSMTGAPKRRTLEIIDRLETEARGVYSGALGYFGLSGGVDLSIVIRTAVRRDGILSVGAGGAIVLDSDPAAEYDEMLLKAASTLRAVRRPAKVDA